MPISPPTGWKPPGKTLIIATLQRSGSTLLCEKMRSTGVLGNPEEYFNREEKTPTVERCARIAASATPNGVAATKLFPSHFYELSRDIRLTEWFPDPVWIYLERRDRLGQAISWAKAWQDGAWTSKSAAVKNAEYSAYGIDFALAQIAIGTGRWTSFFARTGIEPLRLFYEDTLDDFDSISQRIGLLAGLDAPVPREGKVSLSPQRNEESDEWRRRFLAECGNPDDFDRPIVRLRKRRRSKWIFWRKWFGGAAAKR